MHLLQGRTHHNLLKNLELLKIAARKRGDLLANAILILFRINDYTTSDNTVRIKRKNVYEKQ